MLRFAIATILCLAAAAGSLTHIAAADDSDLWQRTDKKGVKSGSVTTGVNDVVAIACPAETPEAKPRLIVHIQALQNGFYDGKTKYNLRFAMNDYRQDFAMSTLNGNFIFEAADFNQRLQFQDFVDHLRAADTAGEQRAQLSFFTLGWRGDIPLAGAAKVLDGLMDGCGQ
ncbi:MAG: hypothetical protein ABWY00_02455 [Dongiaceae bacterium]